MGFVLQGQNQALFRIMQAMLYNAFWNVCKGQTRRSMYTTIVMKWLYGNKGHMIRGELVLLKYLYRALRVWRNY
jgi:hypothetical protein